MALAVDSEMATNTGFGVASAGTPVSSPQTFSFTNTAGTVLYCIVILAVNSGSTTAFGTVTYNGVALSNVLEQTSPSGASRIGVFRLLSPATGANTLSISGFSMSAGGLHYALEAGCISFTGNNTSTPEKQSAGANGTSTTSSVSLTGVTAGNISIAGHGAGTNVSSSSDTLSWSNNVDNLTQASNGRSNRSTTSGSLSMTATLAGSDSWMAAIVEVAAAGASTANPLHPSVPFMSNGRI